MGLSIAALYLTLAAISAALRLIMAGTVVLH